MSPLVFVIYVSDLNQWLKHSVAGTYADDTQTSVAGKNLQIIKSNMEEDALRVMKLMASNGLCANPKKTALLFLNHKFNHEDKILLKIGKENVEQVQNAKLLGMIFDSNQKWTEHIYGTGGLIPSLNQKTFFIRRLKNSVGQAALLKISHGLFISKPRYGLQMLGSVRWSDTDPLNNELELLQKCLNKVLRTLN